MINKLYFLLIISFFLILSCQKTDFINEKKISDCYIEKEIIIKEIQNKTNQESITKITCSDGPKQIITKTGLAESCQYFYWQMPIGQGVSKQRGIVCRKLDGSHEIISENLGGM